MTVRVNKSSFNIREKLSELGRKFGLKGSELAAAETVQEARDLVSAGRKNLIINGDMRIAQRATSATVANDTYATVDRFNTWINYSSGTHLMSQESDAPPGFSKSVKYTSSATTAQYHIFQQNIEANNLGHINAGTNDALPLTMSFWVKSNRPSTYNFEIINDAGSHHIVKQYTIKQSGVWEHKVIDIPPQTVGGAMTVDNTTGYFLYWFLGGSSSYNGTALTDNWVSYLSTRRNEGGNATLDSGEYWMITGIQLEVGNNATDFEHRSYGEELSLCQRYYGKIRLSNQEWIYNESNSTWGKWWMGYIPFSMRINPNIDSTDLTGGVSVSGLSGTVSTIAPQTPGDTPGRVSMRVTMTVDSGTARAIYHTDGWAGDYLAFDAEL